MSETGDIGLPGPAEIARAIARLPGDLAAIGAERAASGGVARLLFDHAAIRAEVRGSRPTPREVEVVISNQRTYVWCTCRAPGPCVHAAAALAAAAAAAPEPAAAASPLRRLAALSREELAALLLRRAKTDETFSLWLGARTALHARAGPSAVADVTAYASALLAGRSARDASRSWASRTNEIVRILRPLSRTWRSARDHRSDCRPGLGLAWPIAVRGRSSSSTALITRGKRATTSVDVPDRQMPRSQAIIAGATRSAASAKRALPAGGALGDRGEASLLAHYW